MGGHFSIFRLYRWVNDAGEHYLLAKAELPEFANWDQNSEDDAHTEVERRFQEIIELETRSAAMPVKLIAVWESGYPEGDFFYEPTTGIELDIWFSLDSVHPGYFVFGAQIDEASFWAAMEDMSRDGEICEISVYARPAQRKRVRFVQSGGQINVGRD